MEELLAALGLPPEATIEQVIAAIIALGVDMDDIQTALDMQREPASSEAEEPERSEENGNDAVVAALTQLVADKQAEQATEQEQRSENLETENRNLRGKLALSSAQRSAAPASQPRQGDTTGGGNGGE